MYPEAIVSLLKYVFPTLSYHSSFRLSLVFRQSGVHQHVLLLRQASASASSGLWGKSKLLRSKRPNNHLKRVPRSEHLYEVSRCVPKDQIFGDEIIYKCKRERFIHATYFK